LDENNDIHVADLFQEVEPTSVEVTPSVSTNQKPINGNQSANSNATDDLIISAQVGSVINLPKQLYNRLAKVNVSPLQDRQ